MNHYLKNRAGKGEPLIWLTGMGLAIGLIMVVALIGLILKKGTASFWPRPVVQISVQGEENPLLGEVVVIRDKAKVGKQNKDKSQEWQLFIGNKDVFGESFKYIDKNSIAKVSYPEDVIVMERLEYGDGIGIPEKLVLNKGKETILFTDPTFKQRFDDRIKTLVARWKEIKEIEKIKIGAINRKMEDLSISIKSLEHRINARRDHRQSEMPC